MNSSFPGTAVSAGACLYFLQAVSLLTVALVWENIYFTKSYPGYIILLIKQKCASLSSLYNIPPGYVLAGLYGLRTLKANFVVITSLRHSNSLKKKKLVNFMSCW